MKTYEPIHFDQFESELKNRLPGIDIGCYINSEDLDIVVDFEVEFLGKHHFGQARFNQSEIKSRRDPSDFWSQQLRLIVDQVSDWARKIAPQYLYFYPEGKSWFAKWGPAGAYRATTINATDYHIASWFVERGITPHFRQEPGYPEGVGYWVAELSSDQAVLAKMTWSNV